MVLAAKGSGLLQADNVHWPLHNAYQRSIPPRILAKGAGRLFRQRAADLAGADPVARAENRLGELLDRAGLSLHEMQGNAFRRPRPDAGQLAQRSDQGSDWFRQNGHVRRCCVLPGALRPERSALSILNSPTLNATRTTQH